MAAQTLIEWQFDVGEVVQIKSTKMQVKILGRTYTETVDGLPGRQWYNLVSESTGATYIFWASEIERV